MPVVDAIVGLHLDFAVYRTIENQQTSRRMKSGLILLLVTLGFQLSANAVTLTLNRPVVTNDFQGALVLTIGGLAPRQAVRVERFLDFNTNGIVDSGDRMTQCFGVVDGHRPMIGGVRNFNVPGDDDSLTNGVIKAQLFFPGVSLRDSAAGSYIFRVADPANVFMPVQKPFTVKQLVRAQGIRGTIRDSAGEPISNAYVLVVNRQMFFSAVAADQNGQYTAYTAQGSYSLLAEGHDGISGFSEAPFVSPGTFVTNNLTVYKTDQRLSGRVLDSISGAPVRGARVEASVWSLGQSSAITDWDGSYSLPVAPDTWNIEVDAEHLALSGYTSPSDQVVEIGTTNVVLDLFAHKAKALVYGKMTNAVGAPVASIAMYARKASSGQQTFHTDVAGRTLGGSGLYYLAVPSRTNAVISSSYELARRSLYSTLPYHHFSLTNGQTGKRDIRVSRPSTEMRGRITATDGTPLSKIELTLRDNWGFAPAVTGIDGRFAIPVFGENPSLDFDEKQLASLKLLAPQSQWLHMTNGIHQTNNFVLHNITTNITGWVKGADNAPLTNITITAISMENGYWAFPSYRNETRTESNGFFSIPTYDASWLILPSERDLAALGYDAAESVTITSSNHTPHTFIAQPFTAELTGKVLTSTGEPFTNAYFSAYNDSAVSGTRTYEGQTDAAGNFAVRGKPGDWTVRLYPPFAGGDYFFPSETNFTVTAEEQAPVEIIIHKATATISGTVRDSNGRALADIEVEGTVSSSSPLVWPTTTAVTDSNGRYSLKVYDGLWEVAVDCQDLRWRSLGCAEKTEVTVAGSNILHNITLPQLTNEVRGRVVDMAGQPVANISVTGERSVPAPWLQMVTDSQGYFKSKIEPGTWILKVGYFPTEIAPGEITFTLPAHQFVTNVVILAPRRNASVSGVVTNQAGDGMYGKWISATTTNQGTRFSIQAMTGSDGSYTLQLFRGTWDIKLVCGFFSDYICPASRRVAVTNEATVNFMLQPKPPLTVTTTALPAGTNGVGYSFQLKTAGGSGWAYPSWSIVSGSIPLTITSGGWIFGTPSETGSFEFTVHVTDGNETIQEPLVLTIVSPPCEVTLGDGAINAPAAGAEEELHVISSGPCEIYIDSTNEWINAFVVDSTHINCIVSPNPSSVPRSGVIQIGTTLIPVRQAGVRAPDFLVGKKLVLLNEWPRLSLVFRPTESFVYNLIGGTPTVAPWEYSRNGESTGDVFLQFGDDPTDRLELSFATPRTGTARLSTDPDQFTFALMNSTPDINLDGHTDLVWYDSANGSVTPWFLHGEQVVDAINNSISAVPLEWRAVVMADFELDGNADILWQHTSGRTGITLRRPGIAPKTITLRNGIAVSSGWKAITAADFNNDASNDILWQHDTGAVAVWLMNGTNFVQSTSLRTNGAGAGWKAIGAGDFDQDGQTDIAFSNGNGQASVWYFVGTDFQRVEILAWRGPNGTRVIGVCDIDVNGSSDLLLQHANTSLSILYLSPEEVMMMTPMMNGKPVNSNLRLIGPK